MSDRAFGVEIEFDSNGLETDGVREVLRDAFDKHGFRWWNFMQRMDYDGSEIELKTPILRGEIGFRKLKVVMDTLTDNGCYTTSDDGLHVHHDAPDYVDNIDNVIRLVKSWNANKHIIYQFVDPERTHVSTGWNGLYSEEDYEDAPHSYKGYWACPQWKETDIKELVETRRIPNHVRYDLNVASLLYKGSIEIRLHEGTLNFNEASAWIQFGQKMLDRNAMKGMYRAKNTQRFLKQVEINPDAEMQLIDKARMYRGSVV